VILVLTTLVPVLLAVLALVGLRIVLALRLAVAVLAVRLARRRRRLVGCGRERRSTPEPEGQDHAGDHDESLHRVLPSG
jgi:hypothetical protein